MYKLNRKSASARFYEWVWNTDVSKFKTMCPYFWKYVLTILFLPLLLTGKLFLYLLPAKKQIGKGCEYIAETKVGQATGKIATKVFSPSRTWDIIGKGFKWLYFIGVGIVAIILLYKFFTNIVTGLAIVGGITILFGVIMLIGWLFEEYDLKAKIASPFKLFGNMVYSLYKNVCPMIKWD